MIRPHQCPISGWPLISALVRSATGVSGAIQLRRWTMGGKALRGGGRRAKSNRPLMRRGWLPTAASPVLSAIYIYG